MVQEMNTLAVNLGTSIANVAAANVGTPEATHGSFAQEIGARCAENQALDVDSKAWAPMDGKEQPIDPGKQEKAAGSSGYPYAYPMRVWVAEANESPNTPGAKAAGAPNTYNRAPAGGGGVDIPAPHRESASEITKMGAPGVASVDSASSPSDSTGVARHTDLRIARAYILKPRHFHRSA